MKILMIANYVQFNSEGGNDRFTYLLDMLKRRGHSLELITTKFNHAAKKHRNPDQLTESSQSEPYKLTLLDEPGYEKNISLARVYSGLILARNLRSFLNNRHKPDVIYCSCPSLDFTAEAIRYAKRNNIRIIVDIQDLWPEAFRLVFNVPLISSALFLPMTLKSKYIYKNADLIVAVSDTYLQHATSLVGRDTNGVVVYLGTDLGVVDKYLNKKNDDHKPFTVGYVGTLGASYNIKVIIDAIRLLDNDDIQFVVMGNGPMYDELKRYAELSGINFIFTGRIPYDEMMKQLSRCDIAVNPIYDNAAASIINKVGDYAAAGLPVINTQKCQEYEDLITSRNLGYNCSNSDTQDIASKIQYLMDHPGQVKVMGENNRKLAEDKFNRAKTYIEIVDAIGTNAQEN